MKSDLNPTIYILDEYEIPSCPSIMLLDVNLDIEIDTLGLWYIEELRMEDAKGKILSFKQGDWLFDLLVADVYKDERLCDLINYQCLEA
jgi:hypothetical protein